MEYPYVDIQTPNILDDCLGGIISIYFPPSCCGSVIVAYLSDSQHFSYGSHFKSIRYHFVFSALTCPPVALSHPANILRPFCASLTVSSRGVSGEGATGMIVESSTKQYPTRWKESLEILHLNTAPWPASRI